jgi:hypothetical protein
VRDVERIGHVTGLELAGCAYVEHGRASAGALLLRFALVGSGNPA